MQILRCFKLVTLHKCPALNCNKCGKKGNYTKACRQIFNNNRTVKRLTEEETIEPDESSDESNESIHYIKEIKKIEETKKHYTATIKINGVRNDFESVDWGIPAEQPAVNYKEPQTSAENFSENENFELIPENSRNPEISQDNPTQNLPKTPENIQKVMPKKQKKLVIQEVKTTTYAQTLTQTTQTHVDLEKTIQETQRFYSNTTASIAVASLIFVFLFFSPRLEDFIVCLRYGERNQNGHNQPKQSRYINMQTTTEINILKSKSHMISRG